MPNIARTQTGASGGHIPKSKKILGSLMGICALLLVSRAYAADVRSTVPPSVDNYKLTRAGVVVYTPQTLEDHIDGEAEAVKRYAFQACAYGSYAPGGQGTQFITVDVYQMGSPTDAYGYYTSQRNASARIVKIGAEGYQEQTALNFWKGSYYVKIAITAANPGPFQAEMLKIAQAIGARLTGPTNTPSIVKLLPPGYAPRTEQYRRGDIFAQSFIRNGMVAKYPSLGARGELFVAVYPSPAAAKEAFGKYQVYLTKPSNMAVGAHPMVIKGLGDSAIGVKSLFAGQIVTAVKGRYLIGARQAKDFVSAQSLVKQAANRAQ